MAAKIAAAAAQPDNVLMATASAMQQAAERARTVAAALGVPIYIKTTTGIADGSRLWPTTLAGTLCEAPDLAQGSRQDMADLLTTTMRLRKPFDPTRLSKPLGAPALRHVGRIFDHHGYRGIVLRNGTSIQETVQRGKDMQDVCEIKREISTKFYADRVVIDGTTFRYKQRDRVPLGQPVHDFAMRMTVDAAGVDIPLIYLLKMRGISIGEFIAADEAARVQAPSEERAIRARLERDSGDNQQKVALLRTLAQSAETTNNKIPGHGPWQPPARAMDCQLEAGRIIEPIHPGITDPDELDAWILGRAEAATALPTLRQLVEADSPVE